MKNNGKGNPEPLPQSRKVVGKIIITPAENEEYPDLPGGGG
jgi:hypothetical protein